MITPAGTPPGQPSQNPGLFPEILLPPGSSYLPSPVPPAPIIPAVIIPIPTNPPAMPGVFPRLQGQPYGYISQGRPGAWPQGQPRSMPPQGNRHA